MSSSNIINWYTINTDELLHSNSDIETCPNCNKKAVYEEGHIDQDRMGNDINGYWFVCWACGLITEGIEGEWQE